MIRVVVVVLAGAAVAALLTACAVWHVISRWRP